MVGLEGVGVGAVLPALLSLALSFVVEFEDVVAVALVFRFVVETGAETVLVGS